MNLNRFKKYSRMAFKKTRHALQSELFLRFGFFEPRPEKAYYLMTNKCNYKCQMCPQWERGIEEKIPDYISTERMEELIREMRRLGMSEFGISGGEPLLFQDKMFSLLEYANKQGLYTHFVSNGALVTDEILRRYDKIGGGHVSLSIDALGGRHDELRGYAGAFANVEKVLRLFKENKYPNLVLKVNIVLSNGNLTDIASVIALALEAKALVFIQPYDAYDYGQRDLAKKQAGFPLWVQTENYPLLKETVSKILELKERYPSQILNDKEHLYAFNDYFTGRGVHKKCTAALDQVSIDPFGQVIFCKFGQIGNLKQNSLEDFLQSKERKKVLRASLKCDEGCLLGCMFRPGLLGMMKDGIGQFIKLVR